MIPESRKNVYRYQYGHDIEGNMYRLKIRNSDNEEVSRTPTGKRLLWDSSAATANFGIRVAKRVSGNSTKFMQQFKEAAWDNDKMKDHIKKTALKARPDAQKD